MGFTGAGDVGSVPGLGRSSGEGNGNPLQYSCLRNPMDRGAWRATVHGVAKRVGHNLVTKQHMYNKSRDCMRQEAKFFCYHVRGMFACLCVCV